MLPLRDDVPTRSFPVVTVGLIAANVVVYLWELSGLGLDSHVLRRGTTRAPSGPMHARPRALPRPVSARGVASTAVKTFVTLRLSTPADASVPNVGASGAIAGILGAYFVLLPRPRVLTAVFLGFFFIVREVPAIFFLGFWAGLQALESTLPVT